MEASALIGEQLINKEQITKVQTRIRKTRFLLIDDTTGEIRTFYSGLIQMEPTA